MKTKELLCVALLLALCAPASAADDPSLWPEAQRSFLQDGAGFLLSEADREQLLGLDDEGRTRFIEAFLDHDPVPDTPENELHEGIRRRRELATALVGSPLDVRYRLLFLNGAPSERLLVDCGSVFKPLEIWSFPPTAVTAQESIEVQAETADIESKEFDRYRRPRSFTGWEEGPKVVVYRPGPGSPMRLWEPYDTKRALYTSEMEYLLAQYEELRNLIRARRFDVQICDETLRVDEATGVKMLRGYYRGRPTRAAILSFLEPPQDLDAWAREAAATPLPEKPPVLETGPLEVSFPGLYKQRIKTRILVPLPPTEALQPSEEGEYEIVAEGILESEGEVFGEFRNRFRFKKAPDDAPFALAFDQALRPATSFVARLKIRDEISGAQARVVGGFRVPKEPQEQAVEENRKEVVLIGEELALEAARQAQQDSLLIAPPIEGQVVLGLWRAQVLVTGSRITSVAFFVDGDRQLTRKEPPFHAELRLAKQPTEQVIRAEGYDDAGELVAFDQVVVNQPRGSFRVSVIDPPRGVRARGEVTARAEVVVPEDRLVDRVEFRVNDELITTLTEPPWLAKVPVPSGEEIVYLAVNAFLDDGQSSEAVRFINAPPNLDELSVRLVELYTTVVDRSGRLARGLTAEDFEVREDDRLQTISKFELVENLPLTVGVAIDTSGSMASSLIEAQTAGREFLSKVVKRNDRCFVVGFSGKPALLMPPTDDVEACSQGLAGLQAVGWTALHDAVVTSLYYMRELQGQRALVLLSDGDDTASGIDFSDALEFARRSGVVIFTVGLEVGPLSTDVRRKLNKLAEETGGRPFYISQAAELSSVYAEIEQELRSRYLIAYSSDQPDGEEAFREVEVKVKKRGLKARTISGYYR